MTDGLALVPGLSNEGDRGEYTTALLNILEDFAGEKVRLEQTQRAMLNLLDDFDGEREKAEAANRGLRAAVESLRLAKEAVDAANRELEAFAYSVSHDLRAPLRTIDGFSQVLLEDNADQLSDGGRDSLRRIVAAVKKMGQLIDDLLNLSRVTRVEMQPGRVDLSRLARTIFEELQRGQPDRPAELVVAAGLAGAGDERLLGVVLRNLLDNAWKFTSRKDRARIELGSVTTPTGRAYFVKDNGTGFDMTYAGKLFQPFQRLHAVREFPGTGIGLATVKRIIERHGGRVWIEARPGAGTTVYFTLVNKPEKGGRP
jgi:light-regulated signal transduction histidine kinase (bacteriophytochrome)